MSDLFCAATLVVARHGEAEYDTDLASDDAGTLTLAGRDQCRHLAESLRDRKIAAIWCSDMARAVQTAEIVAATLNVPVRVRRGLREFGVGELARQRFSPDLFADVFAAWTSGDLSSGCPGAETGSDVVRRVEDELQSIADQCRGETVLVISHGGAMRLVLPRLTGNVPNDFGMGKALDNLATCELMADADGWVLISWNGRPLDLSSAD
ncbi:MAG: histidine phosphatase family protein [Propionibacteriales bacterium]|nr:histidine phosphatase family protein [Propionibacteriales bacterium]